jgi:aspartyl protease family protein
MGALLIFLCSGGAGATDVSVVGLFPGKAVVIIDGGAPRTLSVGQKTADGVTLLSSDRQTATFDVDGGTKVLKLGQQYGSPTRNASAQSVTLTADPSGHFLSEGQINGGAVRFLLDTGATSIAISSTDAVRLGIDYRKGPRGMASTANGAALAYRVTLDTVRVGNVTMNNVEAIVLEGSALPVALLGMSFLNRMDMKREGQTMVLTKRF